MTPRFHLCEKVEPVRCALCVGKKRVRYLLNWLGGYARGAAPETTGESTATRLLKWIPRGVAYIFREAARGPVLKRLDYMRSELNRADICLAPCEFMRQKTIEAGIDAARIVVSEYGMDDAPFRALGPRPPRDPSARPVRFGFVGTLIPNKGPDLLVSAFQRLPVGRATLDVYGAGGGPNGPRFERALRKMNRRDDVRFRGRFDNTRIAEILRELDVLVVPSRWYENAPLTLHEAAMAGIPSITADHGGMAEFARKFGSSETFRAGDEVDLERALRLFLDDPTVWTRLAPKRAVRLVDDDVRGLVAIYERLTATRST